MLSLKNRHLYLILDTMYIGAECLCEIARECCEAGVDIIQFRDYSLSDAHALNICCQLKEITASYSIPFIVNNRLDLALASDADGVHLGQDDLPVPVARSIADQYGKKIIIGASTHSADQALHTRILNPDYIAIGPLFATGTKPEYTAIGIDVAAQVVNTIDIPVFAVGGVALARLNKITEYGINRVAVVSAILQANDKYEKVTQFKQQLKGEING